MTAADLQQHLDPMELALRRRVRKRDAPQLRPSA
jgi:hypothetical protein